MGRASTWAALGLPVVLGLSGRAAAEDDGWSLEAALARARTRAPAVRAAARRVEEARARQRSQPFLRDGPEVEGALGRRAEAGPRDVEVRVAQALELGGARGARRALADAAVARESAALADAERAVTHEAASAFLRALHAEERLRLARDAAAFASDLHRIAGRRHDLGEVAALDVNTALAAVARARAEAASAEAARESALGELRVLLDAGPTEALHLQGVLAERAPADLAQLLAAAGERPDLRALEAEIAEAEAEIRAARAAAWPEVSPALRYERDGGTRVWWGGLTLRLPLFDRGRLLRAAAEVRADRLREERAALGRAVEGRVRSAHRVYELRWQAADEVQATLAALDDNDRLAKRSYDVGQIGLAELLAVRRETAETRRVWLETVLEAAEARARLQAEAGVWQ